MRRARGAGAIYQMPPRRAQKPGLERGRLPAPLAVTEPPQHLPAWAQLWTAEDGTALQVRKRICLPNSSQVLEPGDGDAALIRWLRCCRLASFHPKLPWHLRSQDPPSAPGHGTALSDTV